MQVVPELNILNFSRYNNGKDAYKNEIINFDMEALFTDQTKNN